MTSPIRRELQFDRDQALVAADFFESYANTVLGRSDDPTEIERLDAASSLRQAGQWALLFDRERARHLLNQSGRLWLAMGHPFGAFLIASFWTERGDRSLAEPYADEMMRRVAQGRRADEAQPLKLSLTYPQQQVYLLLAAAAVPDRIGHFRPLADFAAASPQFDGVAPIGALGTPIRLHWRIAAALLAPDLDRHPETAAEIARSLAAIAETYGQTMDSAMANRFLWRAGGAPVDMADLDTVGVISIAAARLGTDLLRQHLDTAKGRLTNDRGHIILDIGEYMINGLYD